MKAAHKKWPDYNPRGIETRLQEKHEATGLYRALERSDKEKFYCLDFFPYPSGDGLHVGHCRNYLPTDVISRYKRMQGYNVLHPMGWDAFGEPAEQYAVSHGVHPRVTTDQNTANFRRQMRLIGASYDWSREIDSSKPEFYRWTQYFFLLLYRRGLAYRDTNWQWWCSGCQTTLSSHEVADGVCWRGHSGVVKREIPAWYFRITAYAEQLLEGLDEIDWPERIKTMQRNWIGRSEGCEVIFKTDAGQAVPVFTTRPDTLFGVTYVALAPEHPLVEQIMTAEYASTIVEYKAESSSRSEIDRMMVNQDKTGVFTGGYLVNPLSGESLPVWVADYVLPTYGTGAVMGVPAHDQRDFEFAEKFALPVKVVISPSPVKEERLLQAYEGPGWLVNSGRFSGLQSEEGGLEIAAELANHRLGGPKTIYRMRDWLISRQRYWGTPIPIVYCDVHGEQPVSIDELPVLLPPMENFQPDGSGLSALARLPGFVEATCPVCGGPARRETDTMGGFACSSWYFLRFTSPSTSEAPFDADAMRYWMPVDLYVGGAEHAVLHLLYARFWTRCLADEGLVPFREPFSKLLNQGQLLALDGSRMSKSRGNVITPDSMVDRYGADALRVYELFMAPFDQDIGWSTQGIKGARRFIERVWKLYGEAYFESAGCTGTDPELLSMLHRTIQGVSERIQSFRMNTMISVLMEFVNFLAERRRSAKWQTHTFHQSLETFLVIMAPAAPFITDEIWFLTGHSGSVHQQHWPEWDERLAKSNTVEIAIQINGRVRELLRLPIGSEQSYVQQAAFALPRVSSLLENQQITRIIYVPDKVLSVVTVVFRGDEI